MPKLSPPPTWGGKGWGVAQEGQALIVAILALLVLTLLGLTLTSMSMISMTVATNEREASEALYAADSGIAHAAAIIASQPWLSFDEPLQAGDGQACTGDELAALPSLGGVSLTAAELIPAAGRPFAPVGSYRVFVCDDDTLERMSQRPPALPDSDPNHDANARVLIRSTADGRDGASASIEAVLARLELPALLVDGSLRLEGRTAVMGTLGSLHANGSLELPDSACAQQYFSTAGVASGAGSALGGGGCTRAAADVRALQDAIPVPQLAPSSLRSRADYVLGADGSIRNASGATQWLAGWSWDPGARRWAGGEDIPAGAYYAEGNIELSGNPGRRPGGPIPLALTLIAEGWVDVSGSPNIVPALAGTAYSIVAGTDIRISGNPVAACVGLLYAGDQIELNGDVQLSGQVIVRNSGDLGYPPLRTSPAQNNLVRPRAGVIPIGGNVTITYHGGGLGTVAFRGWRECRGSDPDNPCGVP